MNLSAGEKTRVLLACILMSKQPLQLLIPDEPTNHFDLASVATIKGAIIVISHDEFFIDSISITKKISLNS